MDKIFVVSDGTGRTAEQTLKAALTQFPNSTVEIILKQEIRTEEQIEAIMPEIIEAKGIIVNTLVSHHLREMMVRISRDHNIDAIDLMGPLLSRLSVHLAHSPMEKPGIFSQLNKEYFKRIDSMQFAFTHDDGQRYYEYEKAEILLIGVSRTFKTPLSIYLAFKNWFVANYPIVLGIEPPEILRRINHGNIYGLTTEASDLSLLRSARQEYLKGNTGEYSSIDFVKRELNYAHSIFSYLQCPVISVTNKPIEEIASEILAIKRRISQSEYSKKKCKQDTE
jgi:[pyruvate, water dikinase]-phosphate phosphotransferase / [pyruvate, water dikinase] kinase